MEKTGFFHNNSKKKIKHLKWPKQKQKAYKTLATLSQCIFHCFEAEDTLKLSNSAGDINRAQSLWGWWHTTNIKFITLSETEAKKSNRITTAAQNPVSPLLPRPSMCTHKVEAEKFLSSALVHDIMLFSYCDRKIIQMFGNIASWMRFSKRQ